MPKCHNCKKKAKRDRDRKTEKRKRWEGEGIGSLCLFWRYIFSALKDNGSQWR